VIIKNRIHKLEEQVRKFELDKRTVELVIPWPDGEPIKIMVMPSFIENIEKIYGMEQGK